MKALNQAAKLKVNEIFESIQGEGKYTGCPALFIRLSSCNLNCSFCDTKYHKTGRFYPINQIVKIINKSKKQIVIWTGGEPTLQLDNILKVLDKTKKIHHLETNGYKLTPELNRFSYISFSPKTIEDCKRIEKFVETLKSEFDIKIVTNLKNKEMIKYATILMPLSTYDYRQEEIAKKVWSYCVKKNIKYSGRLQLLWNRKRSI